jgi:small subunit ribosomal protein S2
MLGIPVSRSSIRTSRPTASRSRFLANDDASRAIRLYCEAIATAATRGNRGAQEAAGVDIGALAEPPAEEAVTAEA